MRHLVLWQRFKHTDEALIEMQDEEINSEFKKQELTQFVIYAVVYASISIRYLLCATGDIELEGLTYNITGVVLPFILLCGLIYTYFSLTSLLKEYHIKHYKKIQRPLLWFFLFEIAGQFLDFAYVAVTLLNEFSIIDFTTFDINVVMRIWLLLWIIYPVF